MYLHSFLQLIHSLHIRKPKDFWGGAQTLLRPFSTGNGDTPPFDPTISEQRNQKVVTLSEMDGKWPWDHAINPKMGHWVRLAEPDTSCFNTVLSNFRLYTALTCLHLFHLPIQLFSGLPKCANYHTWPQMLTRQLQWVLGMKRSNCCDTEITNN